MSSKPFETWTKYGYGKYVRWIERTCAWTSRLAPYAKPLVCLTCIRKECRRLYANHRILIDVLNGEGCLHYDGFWRELFE